MRSQNELPQMCARLLKKKPVSQHQFDLIAKISLTGDITPQLLSRLEALHPADDMFDTLLEGFAHSDVRWNVNEHITDSPTPESPINAEFLFYLFMTPGNCDAIVGDLEERYRKTYKKFGRRRANFWYWTQTAMSLASVALEWGKGVAGEYIDLLADVFVHFVFLSLFALLSVGA